MNFLVKSARGSCFFVLKSTPTGAALKCHMKALDRNTRRRTEQHAAAELVEICDCEPDKVEKNLRFDLQILAATAAAF